MSGLRTPLYGQDGSAFYSASEGWKEVTVMTDSLARAREFQGRLTGEATTDPNKLWWASIKFPEVLAGLLDAAVREAREDDKEHFAACRAMGERIVEMLKKHTAVPQYLRDAILFMVHNSDPLKERLREAQVNICTNLLHDYFAAMSAGEDFDWVERLRSLKEGQQV